MRSRLERAYAKLAGWLLPSALGEQYGNDLAEMFRDRLAASGTATGAVRTFLRATVDLIVQSVAMRIERRADGEGDSSLGGRRLQALDDLRSDVRHAFRQWRRAPAFAIAALATMGLGIGASTAMFSVVNGVVLRPLAFSGPDELVMVWERNPGRGWPRFTVSPANFFDWSERATAFESMAAYTGGTATLTGAGEPARLQVASARWNLFRVVGVQPVLGRGFTQEENEIGTDDVVILSHRLWVDRFGSDSSILGRAVLLDGESRHVVGVLPAGFELSSASDAWIPLVFPFDIERARGARYLNVVGRLGENSTVASAQSQMDAVSAALERDHAEPNAGWSSVVVPMREQMMRGVDRTLIVLLAAVGLVMLIACANVVNLLLARASTRGDEFGLRTAMGAGPGRLARQLLVEAITLSAVGAGIGMAIAYGLTRLLVTLDPGRLPRAANIGIDAQVLGFCTLLALAAGLIVGLTPAIQAFRRGPASGPVQGRTRTGGKGLRRARNALLVGEIAMAVMLLSGWGLVARSLGGLLSIDPGFRAAGLVTARLSPPAARYPEPADRAAFWDAVTGRLRDTPQIDRVALANRMPLTGSLTFGVVADIEPTPPANEWASGELRAVDTEYFATLDIPIIRGRAFGPADAASSPSVAIVNETMARTLFPDGDPIGRRILVSSGDAACPCEVVGISADVHEGALDVPAGPVYYLPQTQSVWTTRTIVIRSAAPLAAVVGSLREAVTSVDPEVALFDVQPLERVVAAQLAEPRFNTVVLGIFASLALVLATVGIYGVTSYVVNLRRREMGVRSALGAGAAGLIWLVEREALAVAAAGILIGLAGAAMTTRILQNMLFGIEPMDPLTLTAVAILLAAVAAASALIPAWRAGRIDPVTALRAE